MRKEPGLWFEVDIKSYPDEEITTYRIGQKPMRVLRPEIEDTPLFIDPRVKVNGWSDFTVSLGSFKGGDSASVLTVDLEDSDAFWREIAATIGQTAFARAFTRFSFLSRAGRLAGLDPRVVQRGFLQKRPQGKSRRKGQLTSTDATGSTWFSLNPERPLQTFTPTEQWLRGVGLVNYPPEVVKTPLNVYIGEHSDAAKETPVGVRPSQYLGDVVLSETGPVDPTTRTQVVVPPPVLTSFTVVGTPGSQTYVAAVVAQFDTGLRTALSNVITMTNGPDVLDATNYTRRTYEPPAGWEDYYAEHLTGIYMVGRSNLQSYLDIGRHALNGDGLPDWSTGDLSVGEYHDDQDSDDEKDLPQIGTATVITLDGTPTTVTTERVTGVWAVGLGWMEIHALYGPPREEQDTPHRVNVTDDEEVFIPNTWVEWGPPDDLVRMTVHYATGWMRAQVLSGKYNFATNGCGWTDTGGLDGIPITEASEGIIAVYNELVLKNDGKGYRNGSFGPIEEYPDGVSVLNTDKIREWQATTVSASRPRGLQMTMCIDEAITTRTFDDWVAASYFAVVGPMDTGQIIVASPAQFSLSPSFKTGLPRYRYKIEIPGPIPDVEDADDEVENEINIRSGYNPDTKDFENGLRTFPSIPSQKMYGLKAVTLDARCTWDVNTVDYTGGWRLYHNKIAPVYQALPTDLIGAEQQIATCYCLTHPDGPYEDELFMLWGKTMRPNPGNPGYTLRGRSLERPMGDVEESSVLGLGTTIPFTVGAEL